MSKLVDYLNHLDQNADARAAHSKDPHAAMTHFGLSHEEQAAVKSRDKNHIAKVAGIDPAEVGAVEIPEATH
ncbi:hypothetical protein H8K32_06895 [Undibacterium jejuense]|uniref:Extradiol ring-cleavage dioxygenase LigAB LigA subunit domain-containing protein n=1 Tax=Undibacterium jejuense TaxID=1344949 RepID=A0A923HEZ8_9BURK|nr:hypothetical protein [Undibacterium jejuense]MBC3861820.1 hypothetical protein [Undibacterium jejuense]